VLDVKNVFHTALEEASIENSTWHDFQDEYVSRLVIAGVSLSAVAELLGPQIPQVVREQDQLRADFVRSEAVTR
jgi:hypothetical protein